MFSCRGPVLWWVFGKEGSSTRSISGNIGWYSLWQPQPPLYLLAAPAPAPPQPACLEQQRGQHPFASWWQRWAFAHPVPPSASTCSCPRPLLIRPWRQRQREQFPGPEAPQEAEVPAGCHSCGERHVSVHPVCWPRGAGALLQWLQHLPGQGGLLWAFFLYRLRRRGSCCRDWSRNRTLSLCQGQTLHSRGRIRHRLWPLRSLSSVLHWRGVRWREAMARTKVGQERLLCLAESIMRPCSQLTDCCCCCWCYYRLFYV